MSIIVIKDLPESVDLDRAAMLAITGGARTRGRAAITGRTILSSNRIVNYPVGFTSRPPADANEKSAANTSVKK